MTTLPGLPISFIEVEPVIEKVVRTKFRCTKCGRVGSSEDPNLAAHLSRPRGELRHKCKCGQALLVRNPLVTLVRA